MLPGPCSDCNGCFKCAALVVLIVDVEVSSRRGAENPKVDFMLLHLVRA